MIAIYLSIICAVLIFLTWREWSSKIEIKNLKNELYITQVQLENLRSDIEDLKYHK